MAVKLLLADDERALSRALSAILVHEGYEVQAVFDGPAALDLLVQGAFDAAILDIMMPGMDGIEVLTRARASGVTTPVILLTAKGEVADKVSGLDAGANDYLTKPFAAKELLARIRVLTRPSTALDSHTLAVGTMRLDLSSYTLSGPQGKEHLPNREFQLLRLLMEHPGRKFPTERLWEEVWGQGAPEELNVVWVHISHLRKRLQAVGADRCIRAARNQGYSLEPLEGE